MGERFTPEATGLMGGFQATWTDQACSRFPTLKTLSAIDRTPESATARLHKKHGWEPWRRGEYRALPMPEDRLATELIHPETAQYVDNLISEIIERHTTGK